LFRNNYRSIERVVGPSFWPSVGFVALAVFVQTVFAPLLVIRGAAPSLVTIAVVLYSLKLGGRRGALLGVIAGVLTDAVSHTGGAWTLSFTALALCCGGLSRGFFSDGIVLPALFIGGAVIARNALFWVIMSAEGYPRGYGSVHLHAAVESGLLTAVYALVYLLFRQRYGDTPTKIQRYA
jgi:rod shape-determining protein MreD